MSRGKHLSLEEARKADQLKQFAKEHPSRIMNQKVDGRHVGRNFYGDGRPQTQRLNQFFDPKNKGQFPFAGQEGRLPIRFNVPGRDPNT